jgi:FADH2 O2-dependent halogenase
VAAESRLIEKGRHPRFAIGESSTPLANLLLEELADRYDLPRVRAFSKWGTWQRRRPEVACGLKRGFTFFFHEPGRAFGSDTGRDRQLMVGASPHDEIADTHWYRPDFDHALVREAEREGAIYLDETRLEGIRQEGDKTTLEGSRHGQFDPRDGAIRHRRQRAARLPSRRAEPGRADAALAAADRGPLHSLQQRRALGSSARHRRSASLPDGRRRRCTRCFRGAGSGSCGSTTASPARAPALTDRLAASLGASEGEPAWRRLLASLPSVADQFRDAQPVLPFVHSPRIAFRSARVAGTNWALLPSAAGVIDPLLSTGFPA